MTTYQSTLETSRKSNYPFNLRYKFNVKSISKKGTNHEEMSMEFRTPAIKGLTDTVNESGEFNSRGQIDSMNLNSPTAKKGKAGDKNVKRESIYKQALMQQLNSSKFKEMYQDSFNSVNSGDTGEDSDEDKNDGNGGNMGPRKSRFGHG